jgi:hypothetical protein
MATSTLIKNAMVIKYQVGVDEKGQPKYSTQKFSRVKDSITDDNFQAVGSELIKLLDSQNCLIQKEQSFIIA